MGSSVPPSDIQALLRYALPAPAQFSLTDTPLYSAEDEGFSPENGERFKRLGDGILFSKRFILSYPLVLIGLLLLFTVIHWASRLRAWKRKRESIWRDYNEDRSPVHGPSLTKGGVTVGSRSIGSSSSSSTLGGELTPTEVALEESNEQNPLLSKPSSVHKVTRRWVLFSKIKACLIYQPRPIPIVNKTLPSNGASVAVLIFLGLQVFYTFFKTPLSLSMLFVFADRTSLLFVANLPLLYLLAAKNQPIKVLTGHSYESLNIFHRRLGEVMCLLALLHSVGMIGVWYTILRPVGIILAKFLLIKMILLGIGAFVCYELIYFTSLGSFRQRWYELFLGLHVILQAAALVLVWFHHHGSRPYVGVALAIFLIDRLLYRISIKSTTLRASLEVKTDKETVALRVLLPLTGHRSINSYFSGASNVAKGWKATEHVFLSVSSLARKHMVQAHPFTIASKAPSSMEEDAKLELLIRAQDGFSADLVRYAQGHDVVMVRLDGPYGSQSAVHLLEDTDHAVIVAGGSGIAVTWPLVWAALRASGINDLEYSGKFRRTKKILFIWIVREMSHLSWLGQDKLEELQLRGVTIQIPPPTVRHGHPDIEDIIGNWVDSLNNGAAGQSIGVVASGPDGMNRTVRNTCASLVRQGMNVSVEIEKFGW